MPNRITKKIQQEASYLTGKYHTPPDSLSLILTHRCNFQCRSCSIWKTKVHKELTPEIWLKIIPSFTSLSSQTFVEINGGEPLLRKELVLQTIKQLKNHFQTVALNSNGLLVTDKVVRELESAGLDFLKISLYSLNAETHNNLRGNFQAFDAAMKAIELIGNSTIKLQIGILITAQTIREIPPLITHLVKNPGISIILQPLDESIGSASSRRPDTNTLITELWPETNEVIELFDWVQHNARLVSNSTHHLALMNQYYLSPQTVLKHRCFTGQRNIVVAPNGDVSLCFKGKSVGNITNSSLEALLRGTKSAQERKRIRHCQKYCRVLGCNYARGLKELVLNP